MAKRNSKDERKLNYVEEVKKLNEQGKTIIIVTHNPEVSKACNKTYYIEDGNIIVN